MDHFSVMNPYTAFVDVIHFNFLTLFILVSVL